MRVNKRHLQLDTKWAFWIGFEKVVKELAPKNKELINIRENLQKKIDEWHIKNKGNKLDLNEYKKFLIEIDYLKEEGPDFLIETKNVDDEITKKSVIYRPPSLVIGIGLHWDTTKETIREGIDTCLKKFKLSPKSIAKLVSIK